MRTVAEIIRSHALEQMRLENLVREACLREMLERWVSELEPVLMVRAGSHEIIGPGSKGCTKPVVFPMANPSASALPSLPSSPEHG